MLRFLYDCLGIFYVALLDITNQSLQVLNLQGLDSYKLFDERDAAGAEASLFQLLPVGEGLSYGLAQADVVVVDGIVGNQAHGLYVRIAVLAKILLVAEDVDDFCYEVIAGL